MYPRGHRAIGALVVLFALVASALALLPFGALAQSNQVTGLVSTCGSNPTYIDGATVTLIDTNAANPKLTNRTFNGGVFEFTPPPGSYTLSANGSSFYPAANATPFRFDGSQTVTSGLCVVSHPTPNKVLAVTVQSGGSPVAAATVSAYNVSNPTGQAQLVASNTTGSTGLVNLTLWGAQFQLRTSAVGYATAVTPVDASSVSSTTISLSAGSSIVGHVRNPSGQFLGTGVVGWLYDPTQPATSLYRLIPASVSGSLYQFSAPSGTYRMIVDANSYLPFETTVTLPGVTNPFDVVLQPAPLEQFQTTVLFSGQDWNNLTVWRNMTLNADGTLPGLGPANLRDLRLQIDATLGNGDGVLNATEIAAFDAWVAQKGVAYPSTSGLMLLNGRAYNSSAASFTSTVSPTLSIPGAQVWINTSAAYTLASTPPYIPWGLAKYYLNLTTVPDTSAASYENYTYIVQLPRGYEMVTNTIVPSVSPPAITTQGYARILVDPRVISGLPQIRMVLEPALSGAARAKVTGPVGDFYVSNATFDNYQAYVRTSTNINFSAADSSNPPSNDPARANFTWRFESNVSMTQDIGYGLTPSFTYTTAGEYKVNLTMVGSGGNVSYRTITIWADGTPPTADFRTNRTGSGSAIGMNLSVNQGTTIRFDGGLSTDVAFTNPFTKNGVIPNSGYAWDFNGDHITDATGVVVNWTFNRPGYVTVNLTVTDGVGLKSANATMYLVVNDTQAPSPAFAVLDPENYYAPVAFNALIENHTYTFNASKTTDNYDPLSKLNFTWTIPGPLIEGGTGVSTTKYGENITFGWSVWNNSYAVVVSVNDTGFGSGKPNVGNLTQNITVQIDHSLHPDLYLDTGTMSIDNTNPEQGQAITIDVNVTNKQGWATARSLRVDVTESAGTATNHLPATLTWLGPGGNDLGPNPTIAPGATVTLRATVTVTTQGNETITIKVWDNAEPYTLVTSENQASMTILVSQPGWVNLAIVGSVIGVFAVFIFGMYYRRKVKAGEWQPRLRRARGEKGEKGPRREREPKEEKKRL